MRDPLGGHGRSALSPAIEVIVKAGGADDTTFAKLRPYHLARRGKMGEVQRAFDTRRERMVALKRVKQGPEPEPPPPRIQSGRAPVVPARHPYPRLRREPGRLYNDMRLVEAPISAS